MQTTNQTNLEELPQRIYRRHEIPIADYLLSYQDALREEFLKGFNNLEEAVKNMPPNLNNRGDLPTAVQNYLVQDKNKTPDINRWRVHSLKYEHKDANTFWQESNTEIVNRFPTAFKLMEEYGDDCPIANYSLLAPNSVINRHTGVENRSGEFIRIHIPLIVPQGEIFFEVYGEEVRWDDIFAFNNQFVHSAHNYTDEYRLCFLIDIRRTRAGLPPGVPYDAISHLDEVMRKFQAGESLM
jgi:hypothetical protein